MDALLPFRSMAYNNGWANHRLLSACAAVSQAELTAPRTGFFPSLRATLNHILIIDRFYIDALEGGTLGPAAWANQEPCETLAQLRDAQGEIAHCERRTAEVREDLARHVPTQGAAFVMTVARTSYDERKRAGQALMMRVLQLVQDRVDGR